MTQSAIKKTWLRKERVKVSWLGTKCCGVSKQWLRSPLSQQMTCLHKLTCPPRRRRLNAAFRRVSGRCWRRLLSCSSGSLARPSSLTVTSSSLVVGLRFLIYYACVMTKNQKTSWGWTTTSASLSRAQARTTTHSLKEGKRQWSQRMNAVREDGPPSTCSFRQSSMKQCASWNCMEAQPTTEGEMMWGTVLAWHSLICKSTCFRQYQVFESKAFLAQQSTGCWLHPGRRWRMLRDSRVSCRPGCRGKGTMLNWTSMLTHTSVHRKWRSAWSLLPSTAIGWRWFQLMTWTKSALAFQLWADTISWGVSFASVIHQTCQITIFLWHQRIRSSLQDTWSSTPTSATADRPAQNSGHLPDQITIAASADGVLHLVCPDVHAMSSFWRTSRAACITRCRGLALCTSFAALCSFSLRLLWRMAKTWRRSPTSPKLRASPWWASSSTEVQIGASSRLQHFWPWAGCGGSSHLMLCWWWLMLQDRASSTRLSVSGLLALVIWAALSCQPAYQVKTSHHLSNQASVRSRECRSRKLCTRQLSPGCALYGTAKPMTVIQSQLSRLSIQMTTA